MYRVSMFPWNSEIYETGLFLSDAEKTAHAIRRSVTDNIGLYAPLESPSSSAAEFLQRAFFPAVVPPGLRSPRATHRDIRVWQNRDVDDG